MEDAGNELTEQALTALEGQIRRVYAQAAKELGETISAYFEAFQKRDEKMKKIIGTVRNGREWTEEDYKQWRLNQIARGERFEALRDKLAQRVTDAKEVALSYVNDKTPGIYSLNRNYTAYEIEGISGGDFTLLDEQTVKRLVKDAPDLMPYYPEEKAVKRGFDLKFGKQQITAGVTSGILRGSSIPQMEKDLRNRIVTMSQVSSIRAARTAVTQAQNAGRMAGYQAAADMGIPVQKKWVCVKDFRTRWDHGMADGQVVSYDEAFNVGGYKMMFPGDESHGAPGHELYNCRCRTVTGHDLEFEEEPRQMRIKNPETGEYEVVNEMTYEQWYKAKQEENPEAFSGWVKAGKNYQADRREYAEYQQLLGKKAPKTFASYQNMKYNSSEEWKALQGLYVSAAGKKAGTLPNAGNPSIIDIVEKSTGAVKGTPLSILDAASGANPRFSQDESYQNNCQRCVQTYEMRRRGYNVIAKPLPVSGNTIVWGSECFVQPGEDAYHAFSMNRTAVSVKKEIAASPEGARFTVYALWKKTYGGAHVFIAEKNGGTVRYLDPQNGKTDVESYFSDGVDGEFGIFRLDDKSIAADEATIAATMEVLR
jgi:hypothetical protein